MYFAVRLNRDIKFSKKRKSHYDSLFLNLKKNFDNNYYWTSTGDLVSPYKFIGPSWNWADLMFSENCVLINMGISGEFRDENCSHKVGYTLCERPFVSVKRDSY